jgi:hypothetical protein
VWNLTAHKKQRVVVECPLCLDEFNTDEERDTHVQQHHPTSGQLLVLPLSRRALLTRRCHPTDLAAPKKINSNGGKDNQNPADEFLLVSGLDSAGLAKKGRGQKLLYVRNEVSDLFAFLNISSTISLVSGPPGTGKSSVTWAWACLQAAKGISTSVLWAHLRTGSTTVVVLNNGEQTAVGTIQVSTLVTVINRTDVSVIVLDGVLLQTERALLGAADTWVTKAAGQRLVHVTSESVVVTGQELVATESTKHLVTSWTFEQYQRAV